MTSLQVLEWNASGLIHNSEFETQNGSFGQLNIMPHIVVFKPLVLFSTERRFARGVASIGNSVCVGRLL